jgi:hypothetical protein
MSADEYLEKIVSDAFKREFDQDENVVRSLPFFAAALVLVVTTLGFVGRDLPELAITFLSITAHLLLAAAGVCICGVLVHLVNAVRPRSYQLPASETLLRDWTAELRGFHAEQGHAGEALEAAVVADLRTRMIEEFAGAATHNRALNIAKAFARAQALLYLLGALAFVFALAVAIFFGEHIAGLGGEPDGRAEDDIRQEQDRAGLQAQPPSLSVHHPGGPYAVGGREDAERQPGAAEMSKSPTSNPPKPASTPIKPPPPPSQIIKKNDTPPKTR